MSKFVAQGACRNYRNAHSRWQDKSLKARRPTFRRKNRTGTGSFLAASGIACIQYDGHRRIRLPYLGSVRMTRSLPEGIPYEATIKRQNGRWYAALAYWKPPADPPQRETQSVGGADVGINPLAVDSDTTEYENPKAYYAAQRRLKGWQRAQARRTPGSQGWREAQRRIDAIHRRITGLRNNAHHHVSLALVRKYHTLGIESLNVAGMIRAGLQSKALSDAGMSNLLNQIPLQGGLVRYDRRGGRPVVPQQQDLFGMRRIQRQPGTREILDLSQLRRHSRPQPQCSPQPAKTCATRGRRGSHAPGRGSTGRRPCGPR